MQLEYRHDTDYFFFSQLLMRHIESYVHKHAEESILNIADSYKVETLNGDQPLIKNYKIDVKNNALLIDFNSDSLSRLKAGQLLIEPDPTLEH